MKTEGGTAPDRFWGPNNLDGDIRYYRPAVGNQHRQVSIMQEAER